MSWPKETTIGVWTCAVCGNSGQFYIVNQQPWIASPATSAPDVVAKQHALSAPNCPATPTITIQDFTECNPPQPPV